MSITPRRTLLACVATVAVSAAALPYVTGYATQLYQLVVLGAWGLLAAATSGSFADHNHALLWPIAGLVNVFVFSLVAVPTYFALRNRAPRVGIVFLLGWLAFYLCCLFFLFPATDGP